MARCEIIAALLLSIILLGSCFRVSAGESPIASLPGTEPLGASGDFASDMVAGADRFLLRQIDDSKTKRGRYWKRDWNSDAAYNTSVEPNRQRLAHILGLRDTRMPFSGPKLVGTIARPDLLASSDKFDVFAITWPAFGDVTGEGLLLEPTDHLGIADVVVLPDSDQVPEQLVGIVSGVRSESQVARRLAESGCRVIIPTLINRTVVPRRNRAKLTNREFIYRPAFELGRHIIGYEVQKVLALVDWLSREAGSEEKARIGIFGYGEGGAIALYSAALDTRVDVACISGYFDDRDALWTQPIDRNVFDLLDQFGDAEVASLIAPRALIIEAATGPEFAYGPGQGGGPGRITTPKQETVRAEVARARSLVSKLPRAPVIELVPRTGDQCGPFGSDQALLLLLSTLHPGSRPLAPRSLTCFGTVTEDAIKARQARQLHELDRHNQQLLVESPLVRQVFMNKLNTSSLEVYARTVEYYREFFATQVIGRFDLELVKPNARSRKIFDEAKYSGYEVVMDVFPDVIAYGILLLPKDLKEGEKRPVVVCQHGLEGRPRDVADPNVNNPAYNQYAVRLTEQGFITFAPQNLYIFEDRFRTLQRKANSIGKTLFSIIVPQHQQLTDWLKTLPFVDPSRIAFYGLSYGGKTAMRVPPLVKNYCLSICSADFNDWVWKNASSRSPYSYVWSGEYEIFEFDLGSTFNYAEMAALIAPRPFMVERGHFDGVAPDETVAYEFAKVFNLYDAHLKIGDRCRIEVFSGPHKINGQGTFEFLHKHMNWPVP
jgi:dienelactone hydrolase